MTAKYWTVTAALALLAAGGIAPVQAQQVDSANRGTSDARAGSGTLAGGSAPRVTQKDVDAVAGGVGINARAKLMHDATSDHNVKMVFSLSTGNYLADVDVKLADRAGRKIVDGVARGPWLYAKLPPGSYTATATYRGESVTETFTVGAKGRRTTHFRWPASVEQQVATSGIEPIVPIVPILGTGPQEQR